MQNPYLVYQRSHSGKTEIHEKKQGLTQSERLVLIMVDGVSSCRQVREKLPVLKEERFARAIQTLLQKELILEVLMPVEGQQPETVERTVIDRFLQQDPLDPVTILLHEEDERLPAFDAIPVLPSQDLASLQQDRARGETTARGGQSAGRSYEGSSLDDKEPAIAEDADGLALRDEDFREVEEIVKQIRGRWYEAAGSGRGGTEQAAVSGSATTRWFDNPSLYWTLAVAGAFILGFAAGRVG